MVIALADVVVVLAAVVVVVVVQLEVIVIDLSVVVVILAVAEVMLAVVVVVPVCPLLVDVRISIGSSLVVGISLCPSLVVRIRLNCHLGLIRSVRAIQARSQSHLYFAIRVRTIIIKKCQNLKPKARF